MTEDGLFSRDEILGGGFSRVRRARAVVFLIEQEARRVRDQRAALATSSPEAGMMLSALVSADPETMRGSLPGEGDDAFIESFRNARRAGSGPLARALANTVDAWKVLLPDDLALRAEVLHQMGQRHALPRNRVEHLATTFGVGTPDFDAAYQRVASESVDTAFAAPMGWFAWWSSGRKKG
ncbi:MAG: hypothetical protein ACKPDI_03775 [Actinomycetota bacterium]